RDAGERLAAAREHLHAARRAEVAATERDRERRAELDRAEAAAANAQRDVAVREAALLERRSLLEARDAHDAAELAAHPDALGGAEARAVAATADAAGASAEVAEARRRETEAAEVRRVRRAELERLTSAASQLRRDFDVRGAGIEERRALVSRRL